MHAAKKAMNATSMIMHAVKQTMRECNIASIRGDIEPQAHSAIK